MANEVKRHRVVSYENMNEEVAAAFAQKYPGGENDFFQDLVKYPKPDGSFFYAVTIEIPDAIYLVKIDVKTDDAEDIERWLEGEAEEQVEQVTGVSESSNEEDNTLPDDNISQYGSDEDSENI